jgi:hypothetical protein
MIWFESGRIPPGRWIFLNTVRVGLNEIERTIESDIDLTEGNEAIVITGCMRAYRQAQAAAKAKDWNKIGRLVDAYSFSASSGPSRKKAKSDDDPPAIGTIVKDFIGATEAGREEF